MPLQIASPERTQIGFIGTGVMGCSMAGRLMDAGYRMSVFNRTRSRARPLIDRGADWRDCPAQVAKDSHIILTMVGFPADVEEVYFGPQGLIDAVAVDQILIDMTTSSPQLARQISAAARAKGGYGLDAPVSGGDTGARNGTLSIMVGGDKDPFDSVLPIFEILGKTIRLQGEAGAGQHTKMCNQITIAGTMLGMCEALAYAGKSGLEPEKVLESISGGAAGSWSLQNLAPRILNKDYKPGFYIKHFIKDMNIALEESSRLGLDAKALSLAIDQYGKLAEQGHENLGTQALYKVYEHDN